MEGCPRAPHFAHPPPGAAPNLAANYRLRVADWVKRDGSFNDAMDMAAVLLGIWSVDAERPFGRVVAVRGTGADGPTMDGPFRLSG